MKIHFSIQYQNSVGDLCETMSACDLQNPEHRQMMRDMLDDYLQNYLNDPSVAYFNVGGVCDCDKYDKKKED